MLKSDPRVASDVAGAVDVLRLAIGVGFLLYASMSDLRTRRVPNRVWLAMGLSGLLLWPVEAFVTGTLNLWHVAIALLIIAAVYALWYVRVLVGGADAKALMAIALLVPTPLAFELAGRAWPLWPSVVPTAVVVLSNSVLAFVAVPLILAAYNLARGQVSLPSMLLGYTLTLTEAERRWVWIVDRIDDEGHHRRVVWPSRRDPAMEMENARRLREAGVRRVWVTPKIPFMVPLLGGFVATFLAGDVLFALMEKLAA